MTQSQRPRLSNHSFKVSFHHVAAATTLLLAFGSLLTGCGTGVVIQDPLAGEAVSGVQGAVHGGQNPVTGSTVRLMAPGITGYGSAPTVLATATSSTPGGNFTLPAYTCPATDRLVYVEATGGNSGTGSNSAIDLVALVGKCSTLTSSTSIVINELSTIAAAYALAPFSSVTASATGIGTSATNLTGLNNAFGPAYNIMPFSSANAPATDALPGMVLPSQLLNTIGDILAACVNTASSNSTNCQKLITDTTVNGVAPTGTFQAALNLAANPGANTADLFTLVSSTAPFEPVAATAPNDFSLAIGYNGGGISGYGTIDVAIDATGNAWISTFNTTATLTGLIEITPTGEFPGGPTGYGNSVLAPSVGVGVDPQGVIWVNNTNDASVTGFNPNGTEYTSIGNILAPNGQAIDGNGDIWTSAGADNLGDYYDTFSEIGNLGGAYISPAATETAYSHFGTGICITPTTLFEVAAGEPGESSTVSVYNPITQALSEINPDGGFSGLTGCSVDHAGNLYLPDFGEFSGVEVYNAAGTLLNSFAFPGESNSGEYYTPQEMAVDGLGNSFVATYDYDVPSGGATNYPGTLVEFNSAGTEVSPTYGYFPTSDGTTGVTPVVITGPGGVAVDGSGNVWLSGVNNGSGLPNYVTEVIGIAAPLVTPKSVAIHNNTIGVRP